MKLWTTLDTLYRSVNTVIEADAVDPIVEAIYASYMTVDAIIGTVDVLN